MPVLLVTSDNEQFRVEKAVAQRSVLIKNMLEGTWRLCFYLQRRDTHLLYLIRRRRVRPPNSTAQRDRPSVEEGAPDSAKNRPSMP